MTARSVAKQSEAKQCAQCNSKHNRVRKATMPQHIVIPNTESEADNIQVWNDRARRTS